MVSLYAVGAHDASTHVMKQKRDRAASTACKATIEQDQTQQVCFQPMASKASNQRHSLDIVRCVSTFNAYDDGVWYYRA